MHRRLSATPCPIPEHASYRPRDSILSVEETTAFDYTRELGNSLLVKPRRRQSTVYQRRSIIAHVTIHEDEDDCFDSSNTAHIQPLSPQKRKNSSALSRPPQRLGRRVSFAPAQDIPQQTLMRSSQITDAPYALPKPAIKLETVSEDGQAQAPFLNATRMPNRMAKPARRGTIYIPNEDTTMPTMYMGVFSPVRDTNAGVEARVDPKTEDLTGLAAQMAKKRRPRMSLAAEPRRGPLQISTQPQQGTAANIEIPGKMTGKENIPPYRLQEANDKLHIDLFDLRPSKPKHRYSLSADNARRQSVIGISTTANLSDSTNLGMTRTVAKTGSVASKPSQIAKDFWNSGQNVQRRVSTAMARPTVLSRLYGPDEMPQPQRKEKIPTRIAMPKVTDGTILQPYPILGEDIHRPEMYEESWLSHQEVAITQLINNLFSAARVGQDALDNAGLRIRFLETYQQAKFSLLFKRLQASLLYGALSIPNEVLASEAPRLQKDIGFKSAFLNLWLQSFDSTCLKTALEVVVGREYQPSIEGTKIFLETFLIRNTDGVHPPEQSWTFWAYQRTFLRSMMMIRLLDEVKSGGNCVPGCLFLPTSRYKSMSDFLQALCRMLNPSIGDMLRALGHIDYRVSVVQYPLEEFSYQIDNLATDLRDGVRLTRLVELLLYPSACPQLGRHRDVDATTTVIMPTGEILLLVNGHQDWPLSQHLKFPCIGRATKLYNIQVALSALQGVASMRTVVGDIQAENIVDGYREKTVALLWGLVGKWGLGGLIDWVDVKREVLRLYRECTKLARWTENDDDLALDWCSPGVETHKTLLKKWAKFAAGTRRIRVSNLTTAFADGKAFEAIVEVYEPYLDLKSGSSGANLPLDKRLVNLGCSQQFAQLFSSTKDSSMPTHLFDRDFTLAALAFLCSRLLSASRKARATSVIQRAWRGWHAKNDVARQLTHKDLGDYGVMVAQEEAKRIQSKERIWRTWKAYRYRKKAVRGDMNRNEESEVDVWLSL